MSRLLRKRNPIVVLLIIALGLIVLVDAAPVHARGVAQDQQQRISSTSELEHRLIQRLEAATSGWFSPGTPRLVMVRLAAQPAVSSTTTTIPTTATSPASPDMVAACRDSYEDDGIATTAKLINAGEQQTHLFCPAGDADWLRFYASAGSGYSIVASAGSTADPYFYLFAPDGTRLLDKAADQSSSSNSAGLVVYPAADGWYFAQVKNEGDAGSPMLEYQISLNLVRVPTATPQATSTPSNTATAASGNTATPTATVQPEATSEQASTLSLVSATTTAASVVDGLLRPADGGAASGGNAVFDAGPADAMGPDLLEPNSTFEQAVAINVGAVYGHLNFVPNVMGEADGDFYSFRAKPGLCYLVQTGDLSAGLDTTILLWRAGATRENRLLAAENDDSQPRTADLSSSVRWCSPADGFMVVELHNYGWAPATDSRGKSYSLAILIDPPTPTPTRTPRPADAAAPAGNSAGGSSAGSSGGGVHNAVAVAAPPTWSPQPTATPTTTTMATATATPQAVSSTMTPGIDPTPPDGVLVDTATTQAPTSSPTVTASATTRATPQPAAVADLTCYLDLNGNEAPDPGEGIVGLRGVAIDTISNAIIAEARSDENGHIRLAWPGRTSVRIALPDLGWNQEVLAGQLERARDEAPGSGHWSAEVRVLAPALPGILP